MSNLALPQSPIHSGGRGGCLGWSVYIFSYFKKSFFFLCNEQHVGIVVLQQRIEPTPLHWKSKVLATGNVPIHLIFFLIKYFLLEKIKYFYILNVYIYILITKARQESKNH